MIGFEPRTSGIASDRSTNWATTTAKRPGMTTAYYAAKNYWKRAIFSGQTANSTTIYAPCEFT